MVTRAPGTPAKRGASSSAAATAGSEMDIKQAVKASVAAESEGSKLWGFLPNWVRTTAGPLFLIFVPPYFVVLFWHVMVKLDGSASLLLARAKEHGAGYLSLIHI